jgi:hypothetical protein
MDRKFEKMCSRKWWLCLKISVHCVTEINFFHSDITFIISPCQKNFIQLGPLPVNHPSYIFFLLLSWYILRRICHLQRPYNKISFKHTAINSIILYHNYHIYMIILTKTCTVDIIKMYVYRKTIYFLMF